MKRRKWLLVLIGAAALVAAYFSYMSVAFTGTRCEGAKVKHGEVTEAQNDCYTCHLKSTPKAAQDWYESKHGMLLVKCYVCHGQPDGKGSVPFSVNPSVEVACQRCHGPAIERMQQKYGVRAACESCHMFHTNSLHHEAYAKSVSKVKVD